MIFGERGLAGLQEQIDAEKKVNEEGRSSYSEARGQGTGPEGTGGTSTCVCPDCGHKMSHERGTPCNQSACPKCGAMMTGGPGAVGSRVKGEGKEDGDSVTEAAKYEPHLYWDGKNWYADTAFMETAQRLLRSKGFELKHMGFGEFYLDGGQAGEIQFDRMRGKKFEGQAGRSHQLYDNKGGKLIKELVKLAEKDGKTKIIKESRDGDGGGESLDEGRRPPKGTPRPGSRVKFEPNPASFMMYSGNKLPSRGEEGAVTTVPLPGGRSHYMPGPGGGLLYVDWDKAGVMGVAPQDVVKVKGGRKKEDVESWISDLDEEYVPGRPECKSLARELKRYLPREVPKGIKVDVKLTDYPSVEVYFSGNGKKAMAELTPEFEDEEEDEGLYWDVYTKTGKGKLYGVQLDIDEKWASNPSRVYSAFIKHIGMYGSLGSQDSVLDYLEGTGLEDGTHYDDDLESLLGEAKDKMSPSETVRFIKDFFEKLEKGATKYGNLTSLERDYSGKEVAEVLRKILESVKQDDWRPKDRANVLKVIREYLKMARQMARRIEQYIQKNERKKPDDPLVNRERLYNARRTRDLLDQARDLIVKFEDERKTQQRLTTQVNPKVHKAMLKYMKGLGKMADELSKYSTDFKMELGGVKKALDQGKYKEVMKLIKDRKTSGNLLGTVDVVSDTAKKFMDGLEALYNTARQALRAMEDVDQDEAEYFLEAQTVEFLSDLLEDDGVALLDEELRLSKKDKAVIDAFTSGRAAESRKLLSDGKRLEGLWMGGKGASNKGIAWWDKGKIHFDPPTGRAEQTVQRAVRRSAAPNDLAEDVELAEGFSSDSDGWFDKLAENPPKNAKQILKVVTSAPTEANFKKLVALNISELKKFISDIESGKYDKEFKRKFGKTSIVSELFSLVRQALTYDESLDESKFELFYGTGGHGGPYSDMKKAKAAAEKRLLGSKSETKVEVKPYQKDGGFGKAVATVVKRDGEAVWEDLDEGRTKPVQHADRREDLLIDGFNKLAKKYGLELDRPMRIDANGEVSFSSKKGSRGESPYWPQKLVDLLAKHNFTYRTGKSPIKVKKGGSISWGRVNHFELERVLKAIGINKRELEKNDKDLQEGVLGDEDTTVEFIEGVDVSLYKNALKADKAFQSALVKQFGKKDASDARYDTAMKKRYNPETKAAEKEFLKATEALRKEFERVRGEEIDWDLDDNEFAFEGDSPDAIKLKKIGKQARVLKDKLIKSSNPNLDQARKSIIKMAKAALKLDNVLFGDDKGKMQDLAKGKFPDSPMNPVIAASARLVKLCNPDPSFADDVDLKESLMSIINGDLTERMMSRPGGRGVTVAVQKEWDKIKRHTDAIARFAKDLESMVGKKKVGRKFELLLNYLQNEVGNLRLAYSEDKDGDDGEANMDEAKDRVKAKLGKLPILKTDDVQFIADILDTQEIEVNEDRAAGLFEALEDADEDRDRMVRQVAEMLDDEHRVRFLSLPAMDMIELASRV